MSELNIPSNPQKSEKPDLYRKNDKFSKIYFYLLPLTVPLSVFIFTFLFYNCCSYLLWIPLLVIYEVTLWSYIILYHKKRGNVFTKERFNSLGFKGKRAWLYYLLVYGPILFSIPTFIIQYLPELSINMTLALILASFINGPSEEIYWRGCLETAGKNGNVSQKIRLIYAPIVFAFWHTAFVYHLVPHDENWFGFWGMIIGTTWISGLIWMYVLQKTDKLLPQCLYHALANFFSVFPMILITILKLQF